MSNKRTILLVVVVVAIIGIIYFLESSKATPQDTATENSDIRVEDVFEAVEENVEEPGSPSETAPIEETEKSTAPKEQEKIAVTKTRQEEIAEKAQKYERAKEISTPDHFINTEPFTIQELIGKKVILVDFWTYSCINCQRTTPYLNAWYDKYADDGLVIVGIHTPEFEFEKDIDNVEKATAALGIEYPVVMDNDYSTWSAYLNRYWPRKYLIDIDGFIVYDHIGEGGYDETEAKIVELLNEKNELMGEEMLALDMSEPKEADAVDFTKIRTRETYFGSLRVEFLANLPDESCLSGTCEYTAPDEVPKNLCALDGTWEIRPEDAVLRGDSGSLFSNFTASKVNLVAGAVKPVRAEIYLDGELVNGQAGSDVVNGVVTFEEHKLYNLIDLKGEYGTHTLEVRFLDPEVSIYAFTFG